MKKIIYSLSLLLLSFIGPISAQNELSEYLVIAAENNPNLKAKFNQYMATLKRIPQAEALPDPTVAFGYFIQPVDTKNGPQQAKISVSQLFPWFGTLSSRKHSAESMAKVKYELFEESKSKLFYDVKSTYYNLYFIHHAIAITKENIKLLASFSGLANIKIESGASSSVDAYRVQMEINDLKNQLALLQDNATVLRVKFNNFLNRDIKSEIHIVKEFSEMPLLDKHDALNSIRQNNHALSAFDHQIEGLRHEQQVAKKEGLPQFSIGLDYTFIAKGNSTSSDAGQDAFMFPKIGLTIPLYRKKYKAKVEEVIYLQRAKANEKEAQENTLTLLFEDVWKEYQDALRRTVLYREQEDLAEKSLSILESEYATNNLNFEEILRMDHKLLQYGLENQKAIADARAAIAFIHYLQGN